MNNKSYGSMHIEGIKTMSNLVSRYEHDMRLSWAETACPDADIYNDYIIKIENNKIKQFAEERLKSLGYGYGKNDKHVKSNERIAFEVVMDFTPEMAGKINIKDFETDCLEWLKNEFDPCADKYGSNILGFVYHGDEKSNLSEDGEDLGNGHIHAIIQPIDEHGNLNVNRFLGDRRNFVRMQNSFYEHVSKKHGLSRGEKGCVSQHESNRQYNKRIAAEHKKGDIRPKEHENLQDYEKRVKKAFYTINTKNQSERKRLQTANSHLELKINEQQQEIDNLENLLSQAKYNYEIKKKSKRFKYLQYALKYFPDRKNMENIIKGVELMIEKGKEFIKNTLHIKDKNVNNVDNVNKNVDNIEDNLEEK